jgi:hypothetical protein
MDEQLQKSLTDLIDETLAELEELKKSRFQASEISIEGPGDGIAGKPSDGDLNAKKAEDEKEEDKEDKKDEKAEDKEEAKKAEDCAKAEDKKDDEKKKEEKKEPHKDDPKHEEKEKAMAEKLLDMHKGEMKKSISDTETLLKSYVDERFSAFEAQLSGIAQAISKLSDQPVAPKGVTAATPLFKHAEETSTQSLSKSEVAGKLIDLKKSGQNVDSMDVVKAEMGQDLESIVKKYKIS